MLDDSEELKITFLATANFGSYNVEVILVTDMLQCAGYAPETIR